MPGSSLTPADVSGVVVPKDGGAADAAAVKPMTGGAAIVPMPLAGGRKKRGTRRLSKKVLKMLKKMPKAKLAKMMKGAGEEMAEESVGGKKGKTARRTRRSGLLY